MGSARSNYIETIQEAETTTEINYQETQKVDKKTEADHKKAKTSRGLF